MPGQSPVPASSAASSSSQGKNASEEPPLPPPASDAESQAVMSTMKEMLGALSEVQLSGTEKKMLGDVTKVCATFLLLLYTTQLSGFASYSFFFSLHVYCFVRSFLRYVIFFIRIYFFAFWFCTFCFSFICAMLGGFFTAAEAFWGWDQGKVVCAYVVTSSRFFFFFFLCKKVHEST